MSELVQHLFPPSQFKGTTMCLPVPIATFRAIMLSETHAALALCPLLLAFCSLWYFFAVLCLLLVQASLCIYFFCVHL